MKNQLLGVVSILSLAAAVGCGDEVFYQGQGGAGGEGASSSSSGTGAGTTTSSSSSGTGGSGGVMPPECQVETNLPPPYELAFDFVNNGPTQLYLAQDCNLQYTVTSCADGYAAPLAIRPDCTVDCTAEPNDCILCESCPFGGFPVASGDALADFWSGHTYTFGDNQAGCTCHNSFEAAPGLYHISVPVYGSEQDVQLGQPMWIIEQDFSLPAPAGQVTIWLDQGFDASSS